MVCALKTILAVFLTLAGVCCASAAASGAGDPESQRKPPTLQLANDRVKATIWLPDAETGMYRGTRFDWSGIVALVETGGHRFFAPWQKHHNPKGHDHAQGIVEEFDLDKALGYDEVGPGGSFVKIGVGVLERASDKPYQFFGKYAILRAPVWDIEHGDDWITFEQRLVPGRGWGYRYRKRIELTSDGLIVKRWLTNTGTKTIDLNHYGHNFFAMDGAPRIGSVYRVGVPFDLKLIESAGRTDQMVRIAESGRDLEFADQIQGAIWARFAPPQDADENRVTVTNTETDTSITVATDRPMTRFVVWGTGPVLCPETFVRIHMQPAESTSWTSRYTFVPG
jgi:hypothetical protein